LSVKGTAKAIRYSLGLSAAEVASVFSSPDGLGLSAAETAKVLSSEDGYGCFLREVAPALMKGCNLSAVQSAQALKDGCRLSFDETAKALICGFVQSVNEVARTMWEGFGLRPAEIAKALLQCDVKVVDVAKALYSEDGCNLPIEATAQALLFARNLTSAEAVEIFESAGIPTQSHAEKALHELQSNNESLNQGIK